MTCTLSTFNNKSHEQEKVQEQNIAVRNGRSSAMKLSEETRVDMWSTAQLSVIDIPPQEDITLCEKMEKNDCSIESSGRDTSKEPVLVRINQYDEDDYVTGWIEEECQVYEKRKMKTSLRESLNQLEMYHSIEGASNIKPTSALPKRKRLRAILREVEALDISSNIIPFDQSTRYHTRRSKSVEVHSQFATPKKKIEITTPILLSSTDPDNIEEDDKLRNIKMCQIDPKQLEISETILGEGQLGTVNLGTYRGMLVACKSKRFNTHQKPYEIQARRELEFAAELSLCRYINKYIGWVSCPKHWVEKDNKNNQNRKFYMIQTYVSNGDARSYLNKRTSVFQPQEVLQASICLFSALTDAHALNIGILDLKLENFLIDTCGLGWLTDFGSCIEFKKKSVVKLGDLNLPWTKSVASPEMLSSQEFSKASDVFMAIVIIAEMMTAELSDEEFSKQILHRNRSGNVSFSSKSIHRRYSAFFPLLKIGLSNEPTDRPSASAVLEYLIKLKN